MSKTPPSTAIGAAFGIALVTALAQLGLASGLAILLWNEGNSSEWASQLTWAAWLAAASTVVGSLVAGQLNSDVGTRITSALASGAGAFVVAPLIALPAMRFTGDGVATAPFAATGIGVVAGMAVAGLALVWRAIWVNVASCIGLVWALAIMAALVPLGSSDNVVNLGVWGVWFREWAAPPLWAGTLVIGMITAWALSSGSTSNHRASAISGAVSPLLLSVAYAASWQPDIGVPVDLAELGIGGGAALSGLLGSLLVTAWRKPAIVPEAAPAPAPATATAAVPEVESARPTAAIPAASATDYSDPVYSQPTQQVPASPSPVTDPYATDAYDPYDEAALGEFAEPRPEEIPAEVTAEPLMPPAPEAPEPTTKQVKAKTKRKSKAKPVEETPAEAETETSTVTRTEPDDTESWVSDLRDDTTAGFLAQDETTPAEEEPKKKRRWGKKKNDEE